MLDEIILPTFEYTSGIYKNSKKRKVSCLGSWESNYDPRHRLIDYSAFNLKLNLKEDNVFTDFYLSVRTPNEVTEMNDFLKCESFYHIQTELIGYLNREEGKNYRVSCRYAFNDGKLAHSSSYSENDEEFNPIRGWFLSKAILGQLLNNNVLTGELKDNLEPIIKLSYDDLRDYWNRYYIDKIN